jgi:NAD-dependent deacetylase
MSYITVFTGAGVSAESGVPTFRDNNGLWENHRVEDVASPRGFQKNPQLVWDFYKQRYDNLKTIKPNRAHDELVKLEEWAEKQGHDFLLITQNIDGLHQQAGSKNVIELHGDLRSLRCQTCEYTTNEAEYWELAEVPICPCCGANMRVNVVWFGEGLNEQDFKLAETAADNSIAMLVVGTSGQVWPAANLVRNAASNMAKIYECNPTPAYIDLRYKFEELYTCFRGKGSATVPIAVAQIMAKFSK